MTYGRTFLHIIIIIIIIHVLKETNYNLNIAIKKLDLTFQKNLRSNNIRIYDINPDFTPGAYREFEMFSAVNLLVQKLLLIKQKYSQIHRYELTDLAYFLINSSNDILERSLNMVSVLLEETKKATTDTLAIINILQIVCVLMDLGGIFSTAFFFYLFYLSDIKYTQQLLGIIPDTVQIIQNKLEKFEECLESEDYHSNYLDKYIESLDETTVSFNKVKIDKVIKIPKTANLKLYYLKKYLIFLVLCLLYICYMTVPLLGVSSKIKSASQRIDRLAIVQSTLYEGTVLTLILSQLGSGDTLAFVRNKPVEEELQKGFESMITKIDAIVMSFKEEDHLDPKAAPILQEDACKFFNSSLKYLCESLSQESQTLGLLSLIAKFHSSAVQIYQDYKVATKSFSYFQKMSLNVIGNLGSQTYVLREVLLLLIDNTRTDFNQIWDEVYGTALALVYSNFFVMIMTITCLFKLGISSPIEYVNRLKKIMKIIPVDVVLKNPSLKGLIRITAKNKETLNKMEL